MRVLCTLTALILLCLAGAGNCLRCIQCNSHQQPDCHDKFTECPNEADSLAAECVLPVREITADQRRHLSAHEITLLEIELEKKQQQDFANLFCRKTKMYLKSEVRVHRDCGVQWRWARDGDSCYYVRAEDYYVEVCQCLGEACNSVGRPKPQQAGVGLLLALLALYWTTV